MKHNRISLGLQENTIHTFMQSPLQTLEQKIIKIKTKKAEIFYEIQNHKNSEGTTINKHTKQQISNIKTRNFL